MKQDSVLHRLNAVGRGDLAKRLKHLSGGHDQETHGNRGLISGEYHRLSQLPEYRKKAALASSSSKNIPTGRDGKPIPVRKMTGIHLTPIENAEKILRDGFDLSKTKPRWANDYAVSVTPGKVSVNAINWFVKNEAGVVLDTSKYAVLEVTFEGRIMDEFFHPGVVSSPQDYARKVMRSGYDAAEHKIYNTGAITRIRVVPPRRVGEGIGKTGQAQDKIEWLC